MTEPQTCPMCRDPEQAKNLTLIHESYTEIRVPRCFDDDGKPMMAPIHIRRYRCAQGHIWEDITGERPPA